MKKSLYLILMIPLLSVLFLPVFTVAEIIDKPMSPPSSIDQIFEGVKNVLKFFPNIAVKTWRGIADDFQKVFRFFGNIWDRYIWSKIEWIRTKISGVFSKEVEKRKEILPQELEKEKQEVKDEAKESGKGVWQKIKDIVPGI